MKRSLSVPLIFLGTLCSLSGCDTAEPPTETEVQVKQDFYGGIEECQRDWGTDPQNCRSALTNTTVNGQNAVADGYVGNATSNTSGSTSGSPHGGTSSGTSGHAYRYSGPRYFWYRHDNGGYPMALESDGRTRPVLGTNMASSGAQFASQSVSTPKVMPTHMTASPSVQRGGFGGIGRRFSMSSGG